MAPLLAMAPHLAMTNTITGTDEGRFATEGSTERLYFCGCGCVVVWVWVGVCGCV